MVYCRICSIPKPFQCPFHLDPSLYGFLFAWANHRVGVAYVEARLIDRRSIRWRGPLARERPYSNGVAGQLTFSQALVTARNTTLDQISEGARMGGKHITERVKNVKVKYGILSGTGKVGLGTKHQIHTLDQGVISPSFL